jgi:predicted RNase H-like HicB family nuclease
MSKTIKFTIPVEIEVDLDDWTTAYGMTYEVARRDAEEHCRGHVAELVSEGLERAANGASLVGDLSSYVGER